MPRADMPTTTNTPPPARVIPAVPWLRVLLMATAITAVAVLLWEVQMRRLGLRAGDFDDGRDDWVAERRKLADGPRDAIVIIGDSRMLFDTDLAVWERLAKTRPVQLALLGSSPRPLLHDLAADAHFAGLVVIGTAELSYFGGAGAARAALRHLDAQTPAQRVGHQIYRVAARRLAFLDSNYTLFTLLERHPWPERAGVVGPYADVWKLGEFGAARQAFLWPRFEQDARLHGHARRLWLDIFTGPELEEQRIASVLAATAADIAAIRARGGDVVWIRPPSNGALLAAERKRYPRPQVWDRLLRETHCFGIHFEDYPTMQGLHAPDGSHLSRAAATAFTESYVRVLLEQAAWFEQHRNTAGAYASGS
jgi:hypothetical protein